VKQTNRVSGIPKGKRPYVILVRNTDRSFEILGLRARPRPTALLPPRSYGKPEAATAVIELLMMGVRTPETC